MQRQCFSPVWLSTDEQLGALLAAHRDASPVEKLLGTYRLPPGIAHMRCAWMRMAIAFVAAGELEVGPGTLEFSCRPYRVSLFRIHGTRNDLQFLLAPADIIAIEPADVRSVSWYHFDIPFTRLRTRRDGMLGNILLCVGGRLPIERVRQPSLDLRTALERFATKTVI